MLVELLAEARVEQWEEFTMYLHLSSICWAGDLEFLIRQCPMFSLATAYRRMKQFPQDYYVGQERRNPRGLSHSIAPQPLFFPCPSCIRSMKVPFSHDCKIQITDGSTIP